MNLNILTDYLPTTIEVQGVRYPINWDFRTSILFEQLMMDDNVDEEKNHGRLLISILDMKLKQLNVLIQVT